MADATTAAKDRIDRALSALERKVLDLKARSGAAPAVGDDDLFSPQAFDPRLEGRVAELESAGREASLALARAAEQLRELLSERA